MYGIQAHNSTMLRDFLSNQSSLNVQEGLDINSPSIPNRFPAPSLSLAVVRRRPKMRKPKFRIHFKLLIWKGFKMFQDFLNFHPLTKFSEPLQLLLPGHCPGNLRQSALKICQLHLLTGHATRIWRQW